MTKLNLKLNLDSNFFLRPVVVNIKQQKDKIQNPQTPQSPEFDLPVAPFSGDFVYVQSASRHFKFGIGIFMKNGCRNLIVRIQIIEFDDQIAVDFFQTGGNRICSCRIV